MTPEEYFRRQTAMLGAEHGATPPAREPVNPLRYYMGPLADTLNNFGNLAWMLSPGDDYQYSAEGFGKMLDADLPWLDRLAGLGEGVAGAAMFAAPGVTAGMLDDATRMAIETAAETRPMRAVGDFVDDEVGAIRAWHGSPHDFDKFDISKIGTGEGAQAYGHGLYFAENEGVARGYRDALSNMDAPMAVWKRPDGSEIESIDVPGSVALLRGEQTDVPYGELVSRAEKELARASGVRNEALRAAQTKKAQEAIDWLRQNEGIALSSHPERGRLYEVNIDANPEDFLDWDAPLSAQPADVIDRLSLYGVEPIAKPAPIADPELRSIVRDALRRDSPENVGLMVDNDYGLYKRALAHGEAAGENVEEGAGEYIEGLAKDYLSALLARQDQTGEKVYRELGPRFKRFAPSGEWDQIAAKKLDELGIPGIKYLDAGSRGAGDGTRNYVVFDPSIIEILKKYGIAGGMLGGGVLADQYGPASEGDKNALRGYLEKVGL